MERSSGAAPSLQLAFRAVGEDVHVIELLGELDLSTIPKLETRLLKVLRANDAVILDLSRLSFIDSSGIGLLIKADRATDDGAKLHTVVSRHSQVERVLRLAGIDRALPIFLDRDEAIEALAPPAPSKRNRAAA
jgi:anti-sigma B factor antagonist